MNADSPRASVAMVPKTIQIFLPSGDPRGIRIAEVTTRIVQAIEIPRSRLKEFFAMPESQQVGVYFLCGNADGDDTPKVYIGQTGNLKHRLSTHNKSEEKEFWERVIVVLSRTHSLTQTHALFWNGIAFGRCEKPAATQIKMATAVRALTHHAHWRRIAWKSTKRHQRSWLRWDSHYFCP